MTNSSKSKPTRLIQEFTDYDGETMTDFLSIAARDIEDAMLQCGAEPDKDYSYLDLFKLAVQLVATSPKAEKS